MPTIISVLSVISGILGVVVAGVSVYLAHKARIKPYKLSVHPNQTEAATEFIEALIDRYISTTKLEMEQGQRLSESTRTRQVWFVAISGFALLNARILWEGMFHRQLYGIEYLILALPWLISALFAVRTHYLCDQYDIISGKFYLNKIAELYLFQDYTKHGAIDAQKWEDLVWDRTENLKLLKKDVDAFGPKLNRSERIAFGGIGFGFFWAIVMPFIILQIDKAAL